ncbi:hypothetical protein [Paenibacillus gorillae]|uniref:hypothetical protein n=1 Tax=Paenibacillus gorillae TaxID=1243662 RepID=UPI0005A7D47E|nr:hypothetical protein [Paenibacillus gorillae]
MAKALVRLLHGLELKDPDTLLEVTFDSEFLIIVEKSIKGFKTIVENTFKIPLANFLGSTITTEKDLTEVNKSVIGRGIVGGLLFGPAGLVLGGMSGIGTKKGSTHQVYIVSFVSSNGEVRNITFKMPIPMVSVTQKFDDKLKKQLIKVPRSEAAINILKQAQEQEQYGKPDVIL